MDKPLLQLRRGRERERRKKMGCVVRDTIFNRGRGGRKAKLLL
jgi:hypothetical protein